MNEEQQIVENDNEEYFKHSGCGPILIMLVVIALILVVIGGIYLFTK